MHEDGTAGRVIHQAVAELASSQPDATALVDGDLRISYRTLNAAADTYAAELAALGVGPGQIVPLLLPRSARLVALQLAVLKCGAAYAGLDPRWPADRRQSILGQIGPSVLVSTEPTPDDAAVYRPPVEDVSAAAARGGPYDAAVISEPSAPATVFFTSGTTGTPKGIVSTHQAVTRLFGPGGLEGFGPGHATPQAAPLPWDMYAFELWGQLTTGGTVLLVPGDHLLPSALRDAVGGGADTLWLTTSLFNVFVDEDLDCFRGLRQVLIGGEKLTPRHVRIFLERHSGIPLRNGYGPAENCMLTTTHLLSTADCEVAGGIPVGTPVPGTRVVVLGPGDEPCPPGEPGEICVAGLGLAAGYLGAPELTAEKFPVIKTGGDGGEVLRVYRTGDIGVVDDSGVLHFRGRQDRQLKISGHRIEPTEIEVTARRLEGVRDCAVIPLTAPDGQVNRLALFYTREQEPGGPEPASDDSLSVRRQLTGLLPAYLVPSVVRALDQFPVTPNGKLDRATLAELARWPAGRSRDPRAYPGRRHDHPPHGGRNGDQRGAEQPRTGRRRMSRSPWLPFGTAPDATIRLLCLPHAGAGASVYRAWGAGLPSPVGVCPVQPPGREKRQDEPPFTDVSELARALAGDVLAAVRAPYAIFGHSTGALCAFELSREIRRLGGPSPVRLFVAGRRAPQLPMDRTRLSGLSAPELAAVLRRLGGTPEKVLSDHDVLRMIQPLLVADFAVNEDYAYRPEPLLRAPLTAFAATRDAGADVAQLAAWKEQTSGPFVLHTLDGGHFAVFDHAADVHQLIAAELDQWS